MRVSCRALPLIAPGHAKRGAPCAPTPLHHEAGVANMRRGVRAATPALLSPLLQLSLAAAVVVVVVAVVAVSADGASGRCPRAAAEGGSSPAANLSERRAARGTPRRRRCDSEQSWWNPYWMLPEDMSGADCFWESAKRCSRGGSVAESLQLAVVACGSRLEETMVMLKSAALFSRARLHAHIFAEDELHAGFREQLLAWPLRYRRKLPFSLYPITFPADNADAWRKLFKPCASQRLFLPLLLPHVGWLLYVDTDVLFLAPVDELWALRRRFRASRLAGLAPEHELLQIGWYNRFGRHPYLGRTGVNSGVMLMDLAGLRTAQFKNDMSAVPLGWSEMLLPLYNKYRLNITWGDQDLLNIIFHYNPEMVHVFDCRWNFRPDHCMYGSNCGGAERDGVAVLHGNRGVYHDGKQPAFRAIYQALLHYRLGSGDLESGLLAPARAAMGEAAHTYCGRVPHVLLGQLERSAAAASAEPAEPR
ncbi:glucoside xylosyltransferase 1-like [Petromyzon marinus]|uniref:glucoside xylosyltransferase 1-like n=1 Tax=Petromyzon marinus TaxID=7757 RepID=UPI003F7302A7